MSRILIFDGNNIYERGTFADLGDMKNGRGEPIGSTLYTLNSLHRQVTAMMADQVYEADSHITNHRPFDKIIFAWDTKRNPYRQSLYPDYKGNRKPNPKRDAGRLQLPNFKKLLEYLGIYNINHEELEADDIVAWLVHQLPEDNEIVVSSNDGDFHQMLIGKPNVKIYAKDHYVTGDNFLDETGVTQEQFVPWSAIQGCTTDHIKGVHGIGEKTAAKIVQECPTKELLHERLKQITEKQRKKNPEIPDYVEVYERNLLLMKLDLWNRGTINPEIWDDITTKANSDAPTVDLESFTKLIFEIGIPSIGRKMPDWANPFVRRPLQQNLL